MHQVPAACVSPQPGAAMLQEFLAATLSQHQMEKAENMRAAFQHFDTDGSGTISRDELREALKVCVCGVGGGGVGWGGGGGG